MDVATIGYFERMHSPEPSAPLWKGGRTALTVSYASSLLRCSVSPDATLPHLQKYRPCTRPDPLCFARFFTYSQSSEHQSSCRQTTSHLDCFCPAFACCLLAAVAFVAPVVAASGEAELFESRLDEVCDCDVDAPPAPLRAEAATGTVSGLQM